MSLVRGEWTKEEHIEEGDSEVGGEEIENQQPSQVLLFSSVHRR